jgi:hypothetical protein
MMEERVIIQEEQLRLMSRIISLGGSRRLVEAIDRGMIKFISPHRVAITEPPDADNLTDEDWLNILRAASETGKELEALGFEVDY